MLQHVCDRRNRARHVMFARLPVAYRYPHTPPSTPGRPAKERLAGRRDFGNYRIGAHVVLRFGRIRSPVQETDQSLIDLWLPDDLGPRQSPDPRDQCPRMATTTLDQISDSLPTQLSEGRIGRDSASAP